MAEVVSFGSSINKGSDHIAEQYCEPCYKVKDEFKPVAGSCQNCNEDLCLECYTGHLQRKLFQNHKLVDKSTRPKTKPAPQTKPQSTGVECHLHSGETIQSFCHGHAQLCCKICLTINHLGCKTEEIAKLARNIQDSQELQHITTKLNSIKNGFKDSLDKTGPNKSFIQKYHRSCINEMMKLREEFDKLMTETESLAEKIKEEDFTKIKHVAATCEIVIPQINKLTTNLETLKDKGDMERLFVSMKHAESQLQSLEDNLKKIDNENIVREYTFEPDARLKALFKELKELGQILFEKSETARDCQQIETISISDQKKKRPTHLKDIIVKSSPDDNFTLCGSIVLPNKLILITDRENKRLNLIETNQNKIISELILSGQPSGITKVKDDEVAVTMQDPNKIQFVSVCQNTLSIGRDILVDGKCYGIAYNEKDQALIIAYVNPPKVEILNMSGSVLVCLDKLFDSSRRVAISPISKEMYVTDDSKQSIIRLAMNGDVKYVYKNDSLHDPEGICVHSSGLVYVVGWKSNTVHQLDPNSDEFKLLLDQNDGIYKPYSISYCELEDKLYIGMQENCILKVFQMKY